MGFDFLPDFGGSLGQAGERVLQACEANLECIEFFDGCCIGRGCPLEGGTVQEVRVGGDL
jgi:hypothetical protein